MTPNIKLKRSAVAGRVPSVDQLELGEVAINTADGKMYIKRDVGGTETIVLVNDAQEGIWKQYSYTATAAQTTFSGSDANSQVLAYSVGYAEVYLNGILLDPAVDYTANTGYSIELTVAAEADDVLQIDSFSSTIGPGDIVTNTFTGDNSTVSFTLTTDPGVEDNVFVYIDGVYQEKETYSVNGSSLVFSEAPYTDASIEALIGSRNITLEDINDLSITGDFSALGTISGNIFSGTSATLTGQMSSGSVSTGAITATTIDTTDDITTTTDVNANNINATGDVSVTGDVEASTMTLGDAVLAWNDIEGTVDIAYDGATLQVGQEQHFYAKASGAIANGDVVMFAGAQGDHLLVAKADHDSVGFKPEYIVGLATQDILNNEFGYVTSFGKVRELDTSSYSEGDILYFDPSVTGGLTTTRPSAPDHIIQMAAVLRSHATEGTLLVRPQHFSDTDEIEEGSTNLYYTDDRVSGLVNTAFIANLVDATNIDYDNTVSGISANTVQEAIDYLNTLSGGGNQGDVASYTREKFTATADQTTFTLADGYTLGYLEVFLNGVLLDTSDYTANDESTVVLGVGAKAGDELITIALDSFAIAELLRVTSISASAPDDAITVDASGNLLVGKTSVVNGVTNDGCALQEDGSATFTRTNDTPLWVSRQGSEGALVNFYKEATPVGHIMSRAGLVSTIVLDPRSNGAGLTGTQNAVEPTNQTGINTNGLLSLGGATSKFKDLYLSGAVKAGDNSTFYEGAGGDAILSSSNAGADIFISGARNTRFFNGGTEYMRVTSTGNVGIGTGTPGSKLTVAGTISVAEGIRHGVINQETTLLTGIGTNGPVWKVRYDGTTSNRYVDFGHVDGFGTWSSGLKLYNNDVMSWRSKLRFGYNGTLNGFGAENYSGIYYSGYESGGYTAINTNSANGALYLARTSSQPEGNLLHFASNGAGVGYIAIKDTNRLAMVSGTCGIKLPKDFQALQPVDGSGNNTDGVMDMGGGPTNRFRHSYISDTAHLGELRLNTSYVYTANFTTDSTWDSTGYSIVPPGVLNVNGIYLVTIDWGGNAPVYYSDTAFIIRVASSNGAGASGGYVRQLTSNHTGNTSTYWEISMQAGAGHTGSGVMAKHINSPASGSGSVGVTRLG